MPYFGRRLKGRQAGDSSSNLGPWVLALEGELRAIVTTRSQLLPNTNWRLNLNSFIVDNVLSHQGSLDEFDCAVCGQSLAARPSIVPTKASLQAHMQKKTIESVRMLIPRGAGPGSQRSHILSFFWHAPNLLVCL